MIEYTFYDDPYRFDMDRNNLPALTEKNVRIINFLIENDSNYRLLDNSLDDSISETIKKYPYTEKLEEILEIITVIDRQNSTHLSATGIPQKEGQGRNLTASYICSLSSGFYKSLRKGDPQLVNDIAQNAIGGKRYIFSFASKYCTYMARALFVGDEAEDNYSIFDKVMCDALPYYAMAYIGKRCIKKKNSNIQEIYATKGKGDYKGYRELIDSIRESAQQNTNAHYHISRKDFDHLLWYYFKGGFNNSRIESALNFARKDDSYLV